MNPALILSVALWAPNLQPQAHSQQELHERLTKMKEGAANNQALLRQYTWTEQMNVLRKGELKMTMSYQCQYGPDGAVQKVATTPPPGESHGIFGRVIERKKKELESYMQQVAVLMTRYVPPNPDQMEADFRAGNASLVHTGVGALQVQFRNYVKPEDSFVFTFDSPEKAPVRVEVNTYMDDQKDSVTLQINFQTLPDGLTYPAEALLDAPAKSIRVQTTSSNYHRIGPH